MEYINLLGSCIQSSTSHNLTRNFLSKPMPVSVKSSLQKSIFTQKTMEGSMQDSWKTCIQNSLQSSQMSKIPLLSPREQGDCLYRLQKAQVTHGECTEHAKKAFTLEEWAKSM